MSKSYTGWRGRHRVTASRHITDPILRTVFATRAPALGPGMEIIGQVTVGAETDYLVRTAAGLYARLRGGAMYNLPQNKVIAALTEEAAASGADFGGEVRAWRDALGLSQAQAAEALAVPVRTLQGWEQGRPCALAGAVRKLMSLL